LTAERPILGLDENKTLGRVTDTLSVIDVYIRRMHIRVLKHIAKIPTQDTGSYEVAFPDGRPSVFFYWDENPGRRSITNAKVKNPASPAMNRAKDALRLTLLNPAP